MTTTTSRHGATKIGAADAVNQAPTHLGAMADTFDAAIWRYRGAYAAGTAYVLNDVVTSGDTVYLHIAASSTGSTPASTPATWLDLGSQAKVDAHVNAAGAHVATAITFAPAGTIAATTVQAAIEEVAAEAAAGTHLGNHDDTYVRQDAFPWSLAVTVTAKGAAATIGDNKTNPVLIPNDVTLDGVYASCDVAGTTQPTLLQVRIDPATDILSTRLQIDADETSSMTAATAAVLGVQTISAGSLLRFDVDQVATGTQGIVVYLTGTQVLNGAASVPDQVAGLTATPVSATQVDLAWTAPASNGAAITDYVIQRATNAAFTANLTTIADGTSAATTYSNTGLTTGTTYYYRVAAVNSVGQGSYSSTGTATTFAVPDQVTGLTSGAATSTTVPLSWSAPSNGGAAITDYVVQYKLTSEPTTWTTFADGTSTSLATTVTGLTEGTSYDFRVAAVNAVGQGAYSATHTKSTAAGAGSDPVVRGYAAKTYSGGGNGAITIAAADYNVAPVDGDLLIAFIDTTFGSGGGFTNEPTGWTYIGESFAADGLKVIQCYGTIKSGTNHEFTTTGGSLVDGNAVTVVAISGAEAVYANALAGSAFTGDWTVSAGTLASPAATVNGGPTLVIHHYAVAYLVGSLTAPASTTVVANVGNDAVDALTVTEVGPSTGTTTARSATWTGSKAAAAATVAIK